MVRFNEIFSFNANLSRVVGCWHMHFSYCSLSLRFFREHLLVLVPFGSYQKQKQTRNEKLIKIKLGETKNKKGHTNTNGKKNNKQTELNISRSGLLD